MGCCVSIPYVGPTCCVPFCNLSNLVGSDWANENRAMLCKVKAVCLSVALILGICAACGLSDSADTIKNVHW